MPSRRMERITNIIKQCASETILYELKDPRRGFVTVTRVEVTADLRHAKVFVSVLGEEPQQRTTLRALHSARGFIQTRIAQNLSTRFSPEIVFALDKSPARSIEISQLIDKAIAEDESRHPKPAEEPHATDEPSSDEQAPDDESGS